MNALDSSAWIECLDGGPNAVHFGPILKKLPNLIVPAIIITEVRKVILQQRSKSEADQVTDSMKSCQVIDITSTLASMAADLPANHKLPLADSIIYATILDAQATLWTQDEHFKDLPNIRYFPKIKSKQSSS